MYFALFLNLFLIIKTLKTTVADEDWSYENPDNWKTQFPDDCGGKRQSPIDIIENVTVKVNALEIKWNNYDQQPKSMKIVNNGQTVQLNIEWNDGDEIPSIELGNKYVFAQAYFHWGPNDESGSEHTFDGQAGSIECQLVHYKKDYGSFEEAVKNEDGVVVISSIGIVTNNENEKSKILNYITSHIDDVKEIGSSAVIDNFLLTEFQYVNADIDWISYDGSLTTPKCLEVVTWIVSMELYDVSKDQMEKLRTVKLSHEDDHNYRPTQPLNGREVYYYEGQNKPPADDNEE